MANRVLRCLETIREYARDRLIAAGDEEHMRERHRDYFLALAEEAEPKLTGAEQIEWLQRLEEEHENLRAGLDWSLVEAGSGGGLRLCGALHRFWFVRGHLSEGREWCVRVLGKAGARERTSERANALNVAGVLAQRQGDYPAAWARHEESLAIQRQLGERRGMATSLNNLGNVAMEKGDIASARALHEESLAISRELGDRMGIARSLHSLGIVACAQVDFASGRALFEESLAISRELGDRIGIAHSLYDLGNVAFEQGDYPARRGAVRGEPGDPARTGRAEWHRPSLHDVGHVAFEQADYPAARKLFEEGLVIRRELGDRAGIAYSLEALAAVVAALGGSLRAARIWGAAERLRDDIGSPLLERPRYDRRVAVARGALGDDAAFDCAWQEGRTLTLEQAIALALE